jgi:hypothetical protein
LSLQTLNLEDNNDPPHGAWKSFIENIPGIAKCGAGTRFLISKFLIRKFLITKFLITKFLSNKVPKLQNS